ncbi:hypothetical protein JW948_00655 [bacterium]|nr:hypothetical protein [bacterium]
MKAKTITLIIPAVFLVLCLNGCRSGEVTAGRAGTGISVDGDQSDWSGNLVLNEEANAAFGFLRDSTYLYLCLVTRDAELQRQVAGRGLIVWLEADKKSGNRIGIKFPVGMKDMDLPVPKNEGDRPGMRDDRRIPLFESRLKELEIQEPGEDEFTSFLFSEIAESGLAASADLKPDRLVVEMRIPLVKEEGRPYALAQRTAAMVGVEIECPGRDAMRGNGPAYGGPGGMHRGASAEPLDEGAFPDGRPERGMRPKNIESFHAEFTVHLNRQE